MLVLACKNGSTVKTTLVWLAFGLLVISNLVLGLLFLMSEDDPVAVETPTETLPQVASEVTDEPRVSAPVDEGGTDTYKAKAASFNLDLDPEYRIIVENDGGNDRLRSTKLKIARGSAGESGPIMSEAADYVKVEAYPSKFQGTRDQFVTADTALQGNFADEASTKIDGVQARKFTLEGVGKTIKYYFERDGITYFIESWDISSGDTKMMLDDVVRGFTFR